jgi:hypothetical protein
LTIDLIHDVVDEFPGCITGCLEEEQRFKQSRKAYIGKASETISSPVKISEYNNILCYSTRKIDTDVQYKQDREGVD